MKVYDKDLRYLTIQKILQYKSFIEDPTTILIHEMDVCLSSARIDIAVINGKIHGFEIKSEQDTLDRLKGQMESYNKVFDTMTIITCENHIEKVKEIVPNWWGIYCAVKSKNSLSLKRQRQAKLNREVNLFALTQLLWKEELLSLLEMHGITKGIKSKSKEELRQIVVSNVKEDVLKNYVQDKLKHREKWRAVPLQQLYDDWH